MTNRNYAFVALAGLALLLSGCKKAEVDPTRPAVDPHVTILDPAYVVGPLPADKDKIPWFRSLQIVLDAKPEEKELEAVLAPRKAEIEKEYVKLLEEIRDQAGARQKPGGKWSVLGVSIGRGARRPGDIQFAADVGLTKLFARRPSIAFNNVPVENCVAKLCREIGIQESQPRGHNPPVVWNKTDVSAYEAIDSILAAHKFQHRFKDTHYKILLRLQDYPTRAAFIAAVTDEILAKGEALNSARPGLIVTPQQKGPETPPAPEAGKKTPEATPAAEAKPEPKPPETKTK